VYFSITLIFVKVIEKYILFKVLKFLMAKKNFLLLSLDDNKTKSIVNTVSNPTCKKILDFLSDGDGTETEISEKLSIPISTVHYNLKQLFNAKFVEIESTTFSKKGKGVKHYTLANKYIIIAPKGANKQSFLDAVKNILPVFGLGLLGAFFVNKFTNFGFSGSEGVVNSVYEMDYGSDSIVMAARSVPESTQFASANSSAVSMMYDEIAPNSAGISTSIYDVIYNVFLPFQPWEWFLFGFTFAIFSIWLSSLIKKKFFNKKK
jgi:DNA-binding transcriptional ArsR family regulator